jgi:hypothetical protein
MKSLLIAHKLQLTVKLRHLIDSKNIVRDRKNREKKEIEGERRRERER